MNHAPVVVIESPANGAAINCNTLVTFQATVTDPDHDSVGPTAWTDNGSAISGVPKTYACSDAEVGTHLIGASATDSHGATGTATSTITIVDTRIPTAPSNLAASVDGKMVSLTWTDNSTSEQYWNIERKLGGYVEPVDHSPTRLSASAPLCGPRHL